MGVLSKTYALGKAFFELATAWRSKDDVADNKDSGGTYSHQAIEFSATEANEWLSFYQYICQMLIAGSNALLIRNATGGTLTKGTCVYITGFYAFVTMANGETVPCWTVAKADGTNTAKPYQYVLLADLANNTNAVSYAYTTEVGISYPAGVRTGSLDTSGATAAGDFIYASTTTPGTWQYTVPTSPNYTSPIGRVIVKSATVGEIHFFPAGSSTVSTGGVPAHATTHKLGGTDAIRLDEFALPTASVNLNSQKLINVLDPTSAQDAATKAYVDALIQGLDVKASCRVATTTTLPANTRSGNVLTASANGAFAAVDGITLALNERILVKNEATGANNGLYYLSVVGTGGTPWQLTRVTDADTSAKVTAGMYTWVTEGTTNADKGFVLTTDDPITLNTTALAFTIFNGAGASTPTGTGFRHVTSGTEDGATKLVDTADVNNGQITDQKGALACKPPCKAVSTANVASKSGTTTIDGVALAAGDLVLLTAQTTASENGPWVINAGAWTRPTWYPNAGTTQAFFSVLIEVTNGTANAGSLWEITTATAITIDTTNVTFTQIKLVLGANSVGGTLPAAAMPALTGDVTTPGGSLAATIPVGTVTDAKSCHALKPPCRVVATANLSSLSGTGGGIDSTTLNANDVVLLTGQTTASQNGPWVVNAGAWTRPAWYPAAGTVQAFFSCMIYVTNGTINPNTWWEITTTGAITIDTTSVTFTKTTTSTGGSGDAVAANVNSETSLTGAATLAFGTWHNLSSASFDTTLPNPSGNAGKQIGVRAAPSAAGVYGIKQFSAETVDGLARINIIGGESVVLTCDGTNWQTKFSNRKQPFLHYREEQASGTNGGTFTTGAWRTRTLNTEKADTHNHGSVASNQITLDAGTYRIYARAPAGGGTNSHQIRLQNITDTTTTFIGSNSYGASGVLADSVIIGTFTITASKVFEVQHQCAVTVATVGLGAAGSFGTEVYTEVMLWKVDN